MIEETNPGPAAPAADQQAPQPPPGAPVSLNLELPDDLVLAAANALQRPPQAVLQVLAQVIGQLLIRGLGVRVQPPARQDGIVVARGMPPAPPRLAVRP